MNDARTWSIAAATAVAIHVAVFIPDGPPRTAAAAPTSVTVTLAPRPLPEPAPEPTPTPEPEPAPEPTPEAEPTPEPITPPPERRRTQRPRLDPEPHEQPRDPSTNPEPSAAPRRIDLGLGGDSGVVVRSDGGGTTGEPGGRGTAGSGPASGGGGGDARGTDDGDADRPAWRPVSELHVRTLPYPKRVPELACDAAARGVQGTVVLGVQVRNDEMVFDWEQAEITGPPVGVERTSARGGRGPAGATATDTLTTRNTRFLARPALYATAKWGVSERFSLHPGFRLTYHANTSDAVTFEPRLRAVVETTPTTTVTAAVGIHNQQPTRPENDPVFGNPGLQPERALHSSLGVEQRFGVGWSVGVTGFHKHLWNLASATPDLVDDGRGGLRPEIFDNAGVGRVFGGELLLRKDLTRKLYGWVAYTISKSDIRQRPGDAFLPFDFDQTHILTLIASYRLPRGWQIGTRFRVVSGEPITARVASVAQLYDGEQFPLEGPWNGGGRQRAFHQLDLRVDKVWTLRKIRLNAYLDVQNLYNAKNPEFTMYSWNFRQRSSVNSLPIIPSLGLKLEW